ncbi:MAG: hypothetical protein ACKV0T_02820 [Planctomycetales bacterium]
MPDHKADIKRLEKKISSISKALANLNSADDLRKLIVEWRRPGFTTPAELLFLGGIVDAMAEQVAVLEGLKKTLIAGSKAVNVG